VGVEVGVEGPDVTPVTLVAIGATGNDVLLEVVGVGRVPGHEGGDDVATHVVPAPGEIVVAGHGVDEDVGGEDVVAHAGEDLVRAVRESLGVRRLLAEGRDLCRVLVVDLDDSELVGHVDRLADGRHGHARARLDVLVDHLGEVHPVDVVSAHDDDDVRLLVGDGVEALVDRVGAAEVPVLVDPLLGRNGCHVVAEHRRHPPGLGDMAVQAVRLVLREHDDLEVTGVHDVGEREVDEAIDPAERHRRLGAVARQRHQPLSLPTGQDDCEHLRSTAAVCHAHTLLRSGSVVQPLSGIDLGTSQQALPR